MDPYNWLIAELLLAQRAHELATPAGRAAPETSTHAGLRHALGSAFVRLGLRLDPGAAEHAGALALSTQGRHTR